MKKVALSLSITHLLLILCIIVVCTFIYMAMQFQISSRYIPLTPPMPVPMPSPYPVQGPLPSGTIQQPLRDWRSAPEIPPRGGFSMLPINIPTQGMPERFQAVGNINVAGKMLPLFGRRTYFGSSDRWNYYTRTDTFNPVPLPVKYKGKECMDQVGCNELYTGEKIRLDGSGQMGTVHLFKIDGPKYVPGFY